jgi:UDP-N-acetylglucosamine diphosphorylase/glucosamine-1-phosphate N-acetyltransferase
VIAAWVPDASNDLVQFDAITRATFENLPEEQLEDARLITRLWDLIDELPSALVRDYAARAPQINIYERPGTDIHESVIFVEGEQVFIAPGATVRAGAILNASGGPIYIDENAVVHERAVVRGPMYVGPKAHLNVGADVQNCAIGTWSKIGGEVHNSVVHSFSNKAHPGFLGHSYLGRWCNLGADTNTSNLKNDNGEITLYDAVAEDFQPSGKQFLGLIMGDHSKCGINTMFNTGNVVGVSANIFGAGFPPNFIPSFSWGGAAGFSEYKFSKSLEVAEKVMERRGIKLSKEDKAILQHVFEQTKKYRNF